MDRPNALMIGTGEYTTGYAHDRGADSDKSAGVVALTLFDLRRRGKIGDLKMAGTNGTKFPGIRKHVEACIAGSYRDMDVRFESFPADDVRSDREAYLRALDKLSPGDIVTIFTPDDLHSEMAQATVERGCHALVAKPLVQTLEDHLALIEAGKRNDVLAVMEVHKRWDPIYRDARDRIRNLGDFGFFTSYMSQPKSQLDTFRAWAGKSSDISYYLNAHHLDFSVWSAQHFARPIQVSAIASTGVAQAQGLDTEDTITLSVQWQNVESGNLGSALYTSSWIAPKSDVHSQQRFFYLGHKGEIRIDQAHRGYSLATDESGYASPNPLFMKYTPDGQGYFAGQSGYGYQSIEAFVDAVSAVRAGERSTSDFDEALATADTTTMVTAVLQGGRRSLDDGGRAYSIDYDEAGRAVGLSRS